MSTLFSGKLSAGAIPVLTAEQIRNADRQTIVHEKISSLDLMERAAGRALEVILKYIQPGSPVDVVCGRGNNGGDGMVMARLLYERGVDVRAYLAGGGDLSPDCKANSERFRSLAPACWKEVNGELEELRTTVIDALFGTGLSRPIEGVAAKAVEAINNSGAVVFSVDLPSGLPADQPPPVHAPIVRAHRTVTFQVPKRCFFFSESAQWIGEWSVIDIGLDKESVEGSGTNEFFVSQQQVSSWIQPRPKFSHKGNFGHAWLAAGSQGMMGAAVLSSLSCLRTGAGLLTTHIPRAGVEILQAAVPEAIVHADASEDCFSGLSNDELRSATAVGAGPGLSRAQPVHHAVRSLLRCGKPLLLDADALNILSEHKEWYAEIPADTVITPHPKEFARLTEAVSDDFQRHFVQLEFARRHQVITVLKGAFTCTALPDGTSYFNSTGNPAMATAGSGDVLTGIILAWLAQGLPPAQAAILGVWLHGRAGDLAVALSGPAGILASDIAHCVPKAIGDLVSG